MGEEYFITSSKARSIFKVLEDNQRYIAVAESNEFSPRTKHIRIKYHNLQSFAQKKIILICYIDTQEQTAEISTNPFNEALLIYLQGKIICMVT